MLARLMYSVVWLLEMWNTTRCGLHWHVLEFDFDGEYCRDCDAERPER